MSRPTAPDIDQTQFGWQAQFNQVRDVAFNKPFPIHIHVGSAANLETTFPAAAHEHCLVWLDTGTRDLYVSDGVTWALFSAGGGGGALPTLANGVEVSSGRSLNGKPSFFMLVVIASLPNATTATFAHGIVGATDLAVAHASATDGAGLMVPLPYVSTGGATSNIAYFADSTDITVNTFSSNRTGLAGHFIFEYAKT